VPGLSDLVRRRVLVRGRVQGVWFRESCRREAAAVGVAGWVQNLPDGRVEACFEGPAPAVDRLVDWCRKGPRRAHVVGIETYEEAPAGVEGFAVR
jgi:acylphosphatase